MSANTVNRETIRDAFATLLTNGLTGVGKPVYAVYNYLKGVITTEDGSPLVMVTSGGTARQRAGIGDTRWNSYFVLEVFTFVRDADAANSWTEQNVEDALDSIDKAIADIVADNRVSTDWHNISFALDSAAIPEPSEIFTDVQKGFVVEMKRVYIQRMDT
jgi:hypothetical protein